MSRYDIFAWIVRIILVVSAVNGPLRADAQRDDEMPPGHSDGLP